MANAVEVIESVPFVCLSVCLSLWELHCVALPQWYRTAWCTTDLHCAPPTCVVHHGAQGGPITIMHMCLSIKGKVLLGKRTVDYGTWEVRQRWGLFIFVFTLCCTLWRLSLSNKSCNYLAGSSLRCLIIFTPILGTCISYQAKCDHRFAS